MLKPRADEKRLHTTHLRLRRARVGEHPEEKENRAEQVRAADGSGDGCGRVRASVSRTSYRANDRSIDRLLKGLKGKG